MGLRSTTDGLSQKATGYNCAPSGATARVSACSGCAGDYEDPERTAPREAGELNEDESSLTWEEDVGEADDDEGGEREELPAGEE